MKSTIALIFLLASSLSLAEAKLTLIVDLSPAGSFQAVSKKLKGNLFKTGQSFTADKLSVSIESFKTGIDLRDEHTWKHLNASKHPKATLSNFKANGGKGSGVLEVNGISVDVKNIVYVEKGSEIEAKFSVKASSFKLPKVIYLGVGVNDEINIQAIVPFKVK